MMGVKSDGLRGRSGAEAAILIDILIYVLLSPYVGRIKMRKGFAKEMQRNHSFYISLTNSSEQKS